MGILSDILKGKGETLLAPADGILLSVEELPDQTYANGLLGEGIALQMKSGTIVSPATGKVTLVMHTGRAICIRTESEAEVILHVGLDVAEKEIPYEIFVEQGQEIEAGDVIMQVDLEKLVASGGLPIIPVVIANSEKFTLSEPEEEVVKAGDPILVVKRNNKI